MVRQYGEVWPIIRASTYQGTDERKSQMALYELRTYTLHVGKMAEAVKLYQEIGFPALQKGGQDKKFVGYFQSDTVRSINLYISGSSTMTPTGVPIGRVCPRTRISSKASPRSSAPC
jgi:hypothetical protein